MTRLERIAVADEAVSVLRHDVRNKIGSVRNAVFYIRRKCKDSVPFRDDPRISTFLDLIESELTAADALLSSDKLPRLPAAGKPSPVRLGACVEEAARVRGVAAAIGDHVELTADPEEIRMLAEALLDHALEAPSAGLGVRTLDGSRGPALEIEHSAFGLSSCFEELLAKAEGIALLALRSARRLATRNGGEVTLRGSVLRVEFAPPGGGS